MNHQTPPALPKPEKKPQMLPLVKGDTITPLLFDLLTNGLPGGHEEKIRDIIVEYVKTTGVTDKQITIDAFGNLMIEVFKEDGTSSNMMFSCHMDTVHREPTTVKLYITANNENPDKDGMVYGFKNQTKNVYTNPDTDIEYDTKALDAIAKAKGGWNYKLTAIEDRPGFAKMQLFDRLTSKYSNTDFVCKIKGTTSTLSPSVLGADDKLGCYILCNMINAKVPGLYVFHVKEESGCQGSRALHNSKHTLLNNRDFCIAFDRKGYTDIIAHQSPGRCASKDATEQLAGMLNDYLKLPKVSFKGDCHGSITDSAIYQDIIPECMNVSVGYFNQHGPEEHFDLYWLEKMLIPALTNIKWSDLKVVRKKGDVGRSYSRSYNYDHTYEHGYGQQFGWENFDDFARYWEPSDNVRKFDKRVIDLTNRNMKKFGLPIIDPKFWTDQNYTPPWEINASTPAYRIPPWDPKIGLYPKTSETQMKRIIRHYIMTESPSSINSIVNALYSMSEYNAELEGYMAQMDQAI